MDRRIRKTRQQLRDGFAELLEDKSIREIQVKELVEHIDINRSTFYLHYTDIYDMLEKMEQDLIDQIMEAFAKHPLGKEETTKQFIEDMFCILLENRKLCKALIGPHGDLDFVQKIEVLIGTHAIDVIEPRLKEPAKEGKEYLYAYCLSGCVGIVKDWLLQDGKEPPKQMAKILFSLVKRTLYDN